jgi:hypothetical protein
MVATQVLNDQTTAVNPSPESESNKRHFQMIEKTYQNNLDSDYTEKIEALGKEFDYESNGVPRSCPSSTVRHCMPKPLRARKLR